MLGERPRRNGPPSAQSDLSRSNGSEGKATTLTADEFRAALERLDLTQVEAAALIGRHEQEVSQWARGVRTVPDYIARLVILIEAVGLKKARKLLK